MTSGVRWSTGSVEAGSETVGGTDTTDGGDRRDGGQRRVRAFVGLPAVTEQVGDLHGFRSFIRRSIRCSVSHNLASASSYSALARGVARFADANVAATSPSLSITKVARFAHPSWSLKTP